MRGGTVLNSNGYTGSGNGQPCRWHKLGLNTAKIPFYHLQDTGFPTSTYLPPSGPWREIQKEISSTFPEKDPGNGWRQTAGWAARGWRLKRVVREKE
jgi:hypothetical protein